MTLLLSKDIAEDLMLSVTHGVLIMRLFTNDIHPQYNSSPDDFCDVPNLLSKRMVDNAWVLIADENSSKLEYEPQVFIMPEFAGMIYGYYVVKKIDNIETLVWAERFRDSPFTIINAGDVIRVKPIIQFGG